MTGKNRYEVRRRGRLRAPGWLVNSVGADYFGHAYFVLLLTAKPETIKAVARHLSGLEKLHINGQGLTDADLAPLSRITSLPNLVMSGDLLTDETLQHLTAMTNLQRLSVQRLCITDRGLVRLKSLSRLQNLKLRFTGVTDAGLAELKGFPALSTLDLTGTLRKPGVILHAGQLGTPDSR